MDAITAVFFEDNKELWESYITHPFVQGLGEGNLDIEKFKYYMIQDYIYLKDFMKVFAIGLTKSDEEKDLRLFSDAIATTLNEIDTVHKPYMKRIGISNADIIQTKISLKNISYTKYMLAKAYEGDLLDILTSILSCAWSYHFIAKRLLEINPDCLHHEFYGEWVAGYINEDYKAFNDMLMDKVNQLAQHIDENKKNKLREIFTLCSIYEKEFWDMSYQLN